MIMLIINENEGMKNIVAQAKCKVRTFNVCVYNQV